MAVMEQIINWVYDQAKKALKVTGDMTVTQGPAGATPWPTTLSGRNLTVSVETNATTDEGTAAFDVEIIDTLKNDGTANIIFNFDALTTAPGARTVKPGEAITDLPKKCAELHFKAASGTQAFRAWGLK